MKGVAVMLPGRLEVVGGLSLPHVDKTSAIVKTKACGICAGTDKKIIHGKFKNITAYPCLLGHEAVGEVVEVGSDCKAFKPGDLVLAPYIESPQDGYASYWGSFCEYGIVRDWRAMARNGIGPGTCGFKDRHYLQRVLPAGTNPVEAVIIMTWREVLAAAMRFGFKRGESVAIIGAGPVGLTFVRFAKLLGLSPVICIDILDEKVQAAQNAGADYAFNSKKVDIIEEVHKVLPEGVDYSLDAVGINDLIHVGMRLIRTNGKILVYGISPELSMNLNWSDAPYSWSVEFLQFPIKRMEAEAHEQIMNWLELGVLSPMEYISHVFPFSKVLNAFEMIKRGIPTQKIVVEYP